jgi:hypothetical protein
LTLILKEELTMTRNTFAYGNFAINEIEYITNAAGTYFWKVENGKKTRISRSEYELAFEAYTNPAEDDLEDLDEEALVREAQKEMAEVSDRQAEEAINKPKTRKPRSRAAKTLVIDGVEIGLTEKHLMLLHAMPKSNFWDNGLDSCPWTFSVVDAVEGEMSAMAAGAVISTLREKGIILVGVGATKKERWIEFTDLGKKVAAELGIN